MFRRLLLAGAGLCVVVEALSGIELCPMRLSLLHLAQAEEGACHALLCSCKDKVRAILHRVA